jgi:hypothetical protein
MLDLDDPIFVKERSQSNRKRRLSMSAAVPRKCRSQRATVPLFSMAHDTPVDALQKAAMRFVRRLCRTP